MSDSNSSPNMLSLSESESESPGSLKMSSFSRRLGTNQHNAVELPTSLPDEDEAVEKLAQRFRRPAFGSMNFAPSLDSQSDEGGKLSEDVLAGALLDALDAPPLSDHEDYVLEEVADETARLDPSSRRRRGSGEGPGTVGCPHCGASNPEGMRFCVQCGGSLQSAKLTSQPARVAASTREPPPPSEAAKQANPWEIFLVSINEDGSDGVAIPLEFLETTVGRDGDTRFPTDAFLSPKHARLHIENGVLFIEDLYSLNGTFLKLRDEVKLTPGDTFLMGRQVLRFERFEQSISPKTKSSDGTRYMGSPAPGGSFKLLQVGIGGVVQNVYCLPDSGAVLGREKGDIIFPHDKFMSSRHAQIYAGDDASCYLVDLTSSNGTWIKLWEKTKLRHNDYVFMGQQLFRVHLKDSKR